MTRCKIVLTKNAKKDLQRLDRHVAIRLARKLRFFADSDRPTTFAVRLSKPTDAQYRWRIGDYRILFDLDNRSRLIVILKIQYRRQVYSLKKNG